MHLIAVLDVETRSDYFTVTLVGALGQPGTLVIPKVFLQAILSNDLGRFGVLAKSNSHTTWDVPGIKLVQLPNDFVNQLAETLKRQLVVDWLDSFGAQGRSVAPLAAGSLLGLILGDSAPPIQVGNQSWTTEKLVSILEGMAYTVKESVEQIQKELEQARVTRAKEEQELADSRMAATKEKERLDKEVAKYQQRANVSKENISVAGKAQD